MGAPGNWGRGRKEEEPSNTDLGRGQWGKAQGEAGLRVGEEPGEAATGLRLALVSSAFSRKDSEEMCSISALTGTLLML